MTHIIEKRLASLPVKTAAPFRQLLRTGQLTDDIVDAVLDAGELAGDTSRLVGFAAGYLHLRAQGVPVHDVIRMAMHHNRKLNLAWSPARWKDEHDKLSRAEALQRLAAQNVTYDLSSYDAHLPRRFPGYLIRSSRRLGMEGLRQRHCVASYHDRIASGSCAIAAVFADRQRWTVELLRSDDPQAPLLIAQIKTRHNAPAPAAVRKQIHDALEIPLPTVNPSATCAPQPACLYIENLRRILPILAAHGVATVTVYFEGSGDSGSIQDIAYHPEPSARLETVPAEILLTSASFDDGQWHTTAGATETSVHEAIDALTYDYLEETGVDWYNDDGGFGELVIDVAQGTVSLDVSVRYTESTTQYSALHNIATGDRM